MSHNFLFCSFYYIQDLIIEVNFRTLKTPCILLHHQYSCVNYFYPESWSLWPAGNLCPPPPLRKNRRRGPSFDFSWGEVGLYTGFQLGATYWSRETLGDSTKKICFISCLENATFVPVTRRSSNVFQLELPKTEETIVHGRPFLEYIFYEKTHFNIYFFL